MVRGRRARALPATNNNQQSQQFSDVKSSTHDEHTICASPKRKDCKLSNNNGVGGSEEQQRRTSTSGEDVFIESKFQSQMILRHAPKTRSQAITSYFLIKSAKADSLAKQKQRAAANAEKSKITANSPTITESIHLSDDDEATCDGFAMAMATPRNGNDEPTFDQDSSAVIVNSYCTSSSSPSCTAEQRSFCMLPTSAQTITYNSQSTNLFLMKPTEKLEIDQSANQASAIVINKSLEIRSQFPMVSTASSNYALKPLPGPFSYVNGKGGGGGGGCNGTALDLSKPTQITEIDSTTNSDSNSCDSGVVADNTSDILAAAATATARRRKPATPHRILCPSPVKHVADLRVSQGMNRFVAQTTTPSKKFIASNEKKARTQSNADSAETEITLQQIIDDQLPIDRSENEISSDQSNPDLLKEAVQLPKGPSEQRRCSESQPNRKLTDFFPVRRSARKPKKVVQEEKRRSMEEAIRDEREEGIKIEDFGEKGRGVITVRPFVRGEFVVEYIGDLISSTEAKKREKIYLKDQNTGSYMYFFRHNNQQMCIDATPESGKLGRLINHSRNGNLIPKTIVYGNRPHLVLLAKDNIKNGEELTYDYGDRSRESLLNHPWLAL